MTYQPDLYKAANHLLEALKSGACETQKQFLFQALESLGKAEIEALEQVYQQKVEADTVDLTRPGVSSLPDRMN